MRKIAFHAQGWEDFTTWANQDRKVFERLVRLIGETAREPFSGIGKPEALKHELRDFGHAELAPARL